MTLTEYLSQKDPKRYNKVILNKLEYTSFNTIVAGADYFTSIRITQYPQYVYILKNGGGYLYTTDEHGNPKKPSVFYIESLNKVKQKQVENNENLFI